MNSCDLWGHTGWTLQGAAPGSLLYAFQNFQDENKNNRMSVTPRLTPPLVPRGHTANPGTHHRPGGRSGRGPPGVTKLHLTSLELTEKRGARPEDGEDFWKKRGQRKGPEEGLA